jgi:response regulator RpfG family c-di-GMP phosphodiesterase
MGTHAIHKIHRRKTDVHDARNRDIYRLHKDGWTMQRIADRYGLTRARIQQIVAATPLAKTGDGEGE